MNLKLFWMGYKLQPSVDVTQAINFAQILAEDLFVLHQSANELVSYYVLSTRVIVCHEWFCSTLQPSDQESMKHGGGSSCCCGAEQLQYVHA